MLIDRLVDCLNNQHPAIVFDIDVEIDAGARVPIDIESNPRISSNPTFPWPEKKLSLLPATLAYLVRSYEFPCVEIGPLLLYANTGGATSRELVTLLDFHDGWSPMLRGAGFIEIGKSDDGSFDAVCLDARQECGDREYPIVRLDHEVLLEGRLSKPRQIADSFGALAESIIGSHGNGVA